MTLDNSRSGSLAGITSEYAELTLPALLEVEDDNTLLNYACADTGVLLWPHLRTVFYRMALADFLYGAPLTGGSTTAIPRSRIVAYFIRAIWHNALSHAMGRSAAEVCLISSSVGHQIHDGRVFNRLSDYFAMQCAVRAITIEEHFEWQWQNQRHNNRIFLHAPLQAANAIGSRLALRSRHQSIASELITFVSERAEKLLGWRPGPKREAALIDLAMRKLAGMPQQMRSYDKILKKINPKVILILGASYGPASTLIMAARMRGIVTAEFQHGAIAPGHDAYNFSPNICKSKEYRFSLPEYFLSYGTWWNSTINAPINMVAIGNPHREQHLLRSASGMQCRRAVLLLSDGIDFNLYLQLAREIAPPLATRGLRVMIRPHPIERSSIKIKYGQHIDASVELDFQDDLYASLRNSYAVVSELSTGLFEAAGIAHKLFVWDTPKARFCYPTLPFEGFTSADTLIQLLTQDGAGELSAAQVDAFWAAGWQGNYRNFLEKHAGITMSTEIDHV
ncbi:hypothetical protein [Chromobacterium amazonense]|uniref:hypothetical protein n=1 Tax=Chromobacterium amazonense TaxID=1382803 RepID=UPI0031F60669